MIVFRYEKEDGGGPWCTLDGRLRSDHKIKFEDDLVYGCRTKEELDQYFSEQLDMIEGCVLKAYSIPDKEVVIEKRQILFPKRYVLLCRDG